MEGVSVSATRSVAGEVLEVANALRTTRAVVFQACPGFWGAPWGGRSVHVGSSVSKSDLGLWWI